MLLRDAAADNEMAAKKKEGEHWEVAEPVHIRLLLRSGCCALLVYAWLRVCGLAVIDRMTASVTSVASLRGGSGVTLRSGGAGGGSWQGRRKLGRSSA